LVSVDGGAWINTTDSYLIVSGLNDGEHMIVVRAVDRAGNYNESTVVFTVDTAAPIIVITSPENGTFLNTSSIILNWTAEDAGVGVKYYLISIDGGNWVNLTETGYIANLSDGEHVVVVKAVDKVGNSGEDSVRFVVDTEAPAITVISPKNGSTITNNTIHISWEASDNVSGISHYAVSVNGSSWVSLEDNTYVFEARTNGVYIVRIRAYDNAANFAETRLVITVRLPRLVDTGTLIIIGAIIILIVVAALIIWRAKKKQSEVL